MLFLLTTKAQSHTKLAVASKYLHGKQSNSPVIKPQLRDPKSLLPWPWRTFNIHLKHVFCMGTVVVECEKWLQLSILWGVYNELFRVRGFSAGGLVGGNRIHVVYFSQAYVSRPPGERGVSCSIDNRDDIVLRWNPERGKKWNPGQSVHLSTDCRSLLSSCLFYRGKDNWISWTCHCWECSGQAHSYTGTGVLFISMHFSCVCISLMNTCRQLSLVSFEKCNQATWQW